MNVAVRAAIRLLLGFQLVKGCGAVHRLVASQHLDKVGLHLQLMVSVCWKPCKAPAPRLRGRAGLGLAPVWPSGQHSKQDDAEQKNA